MAHVRPPCRCPTPEFRTQPLRHTAFFVLGFLSRPQSALAVEPSHAASAWILSCRALWLPLHSPGSLAVLTVSLTTRWPIWPAPSFLFLALWPVLSSSQASQDWPLHARTRHGKLHSSRCIRQVGATAPCNGQARMKPVGQAWAKHTKRAALPKGEGHLRHGVCRSA